MTRAVPAGKPEPAPPARTATPVSSTERPVTVAVDPDALSRAVPAAVQLTPEAVSVPTRSARIAVPEISSKRPRTSSTTPPAMRSPAPSATRVSRISPGEYSTETAGADPRTNTEPVMVKGLSTRRSRGAVPSPFIRTPSRLTGLSRKVRTAPGPATPAEASPSNRTLASVERFFAFSTTTPRPDPSLDPIVIGASSVPVHSTGPRAMIDAFCTRSSDVFGPHRSVYPSVTTRGSAIRWLPGRSETDRRASSVTANERFPVFAGRRVSAPISGDPGSLGSEKTHSRRGWAVPSTRYSTSSGTEASQAVPAGRSNVTAWYRTGASTIFPGRRTGPPTGATLIPPATMPVTSTGRGCTAPSSRFSVPADEFATYALRAR